MSESDTETLLQVDRVGYRYRSAAAPALDDVSFRVRRGVVLGLVGPNGSGKTTLYRLILGFLKPDKGALSIAGLEPAAYRTRRGIGYLPELVRLPGSLRVRELAEHVSRLAGLGGGERQDSIDRLMRLLALTDRARAEIRTLSHGYRQRVGLLAALLGDPELLLFDEPVNGLDPASVGILRSLLRELKRRQQTAIVSSHNLLELERVCDEVVVLSEGLLLGQGSREELIGARDVWAVQFRGDEAGMASLMLQFGGIRLAGDEAAFKEERLARGFANAAEAAGARVYVFEERPFDLELLFHQLTQRTSAQ